MIIYKIEEHEFSGQVFQIQFLNKSDDEEYQRLLICTKTWNAQVDVSCEMIEKELNWKDWICHEAVKANERRLGIK